MHKLSWFAAVAAVAALASACGDIEGGNQLADAPPSSDSGLPLDAPPPEPDAALPRPVRVRVLSVAGDGAVDLTAKVVFQNPDGSAIAEGTVDAQGRAEALMPLGGMVSVIRISVDTPEQLTAQITSTLGVKPGDEITLGMMEPQTPLNGGGQTTMTANFPPVPEAATVVFATSCGVPTGSAVDPIKGVATLVFRDSCHGAMFDLIGVASGGRLLTPQFIKVTRVAHVAGTTFTVPGAFAAMSSFTVNVSKIPDVISNLTATRSSMIEGTAVVAQSSAAVDPPAGDLPIAVPYTPAFGTRSEVAVTVNRPETRFAQRYEVRTPSLASSVDIDLGTLPLPWLTDVAITPTGTTWTTIDGVTTADGILTQWGGGWNDGTRPVTVAWRVIQPVDTAGAGMTLPRLPPADAIVDPGQQTVTVTPSIAAVLVTDYSNVAGYDELRKLPETLLLSSLSTLGTFINQPFQRRTFAAISSRGDAGVTGVAPRGR